MTDSPGTPMSPARDARLTPEVVAERAFTQVKRGYAESEVRAFLRAVSDDLTTMRSRERELTARMHDLEDRLGRPAQVPSDQDLIAALGEETARVLTQAREAAGDLRNKADEHARRVVRDAQESARELRASTQQAVDEKTREAEDAARSLAREILGEARALRDRVLTDLNERRTDLERQIGELRASRGKLVEVYELVERALVQATRTIAEEPAMPTPSVAPPPAVDAPEPGNASPDIDAPAAAGDGDTGGDADAEARSTASEPGDAHAGTRTQSADDGRDVGALFEKLRTGGTPPDETPGSPVVEAATADDEIVRFSESDVAIEAALVDEPASADQDAMAARDDTLAPIADDLAHRAKRAVQDEQNDVLDGLRRQRGKIDVAKVLPAAEDQLTRWAHVLQPSVDLAYAAGAASIARTLGDDATPTVPRALLTELATAVVTPLRTRLDTSLEAIDAKSPADVEIAVAQSLGARYREWRGQDLEAVLGDALAAAFARGAYDAAPQGARLRWVPARVGKCPDCDDNALEPTVRGDDFPTGQPHPPAHPGCRCLVVLAT